MNRYNSSTPRVALGLAAIALAAITLTTAVVLPATLDSADTDAVAAGSVQARDRGTLNVTSSQAVEFHNSERATP